MALIYCSRVSASKCRAPIKIVKTYVVLVRGETVVDARGKHEKIRLFECDPDPVVFLAPHIEEATTFDDIADLLILVQVLMEEVLDLFFVVWQSGRRDGNLVAILVVTLLGQSVHIVERRIVEVKNAQLLEVFWVDRSAAVMEFALVALRRVRKVSVDRLNAAILTGRLSYQ